MGAIPREVLSEQLQAALDGRIVKTAVFLTFRFEPDFFEQEVLPVILPDTGFSHVADIRLLQLEDVLKTCVDNVAVYYDREGLVPGTQPARLDVRRIPTSHRTGIFHPKNVLLLVEDTESDADGGRRRHLIVAAMSANLTRAGWWENVEVCHIEEVSDGGACSFRDDLLDLIRRVKAASAAENSHEALEVIRRFVLRLRTRKHRSANGILHPRLYTGSESVADFLEGTLEGDATRLNIEIISPYFDAREARPLQEICDRFFPKEVRVFLPRAEDGSAHCEAAYYNSVREMPGVLWARLPSELLRRGKSDNVKRRSVHAKVYRFFDPRRRYEAFLVGSVNLTNPAHSRGGNLETAFLIESIPPRLPDWWMEVDVNKPHAFLGSQEEETTSATTALSIRYDWSTRRAEAFWDAAGPPRALSIAAQGVPLLHITTLPSREWRVLPEADALALARILPSTSFLEVSERGAPPATILVQEYGMAQKPSLLLTLSAADILRYWALLTPEQRAAFLDDRAQEIQEACIQLGIECRLPTLEAASIFDTFAGVFHSFHALERSILSSLDEHRVREAEYRLLGRKYDSLPSLLDRVLEQPDVDAVTNYVIVLCATQLVRTVKAKGPEFVKAHKLEFRSLDAQIKKAAKIRDRLAFSTPNERTAFLEWFDHWFLTRAEPLAGVTRTVGT
jgi:hypothetical protein